MFYVIVINVNIVYHRFKVNVVCHWVDSDVLKNYDHLFFISLKEIRKAKHSMSLYTTFLLIKNNYHLCSCCVWDNSQTNDTYYACK